MLLRGKGGRGTLLLLLVVGGFMVFSQMGGAGSQQAVEGSGGVTAAQGTAQDLATRCNQAGAIQAYPDCLLTKAFNETDEVWSAEFARLGQEYRSPRLTFFDGSVNTSCGPATTEVGPFYCPGDERIYFDLGFAKQLQQLGVEGDYANVYIMAHEFGHHLQNISGIEEQVRAMQAQDACQRQPVRRQDGAAGRLHGRGLGQDGRRPRQPDDHQGRAHAGHERGLGRGR